MYCHHQHQYWSWLVQVHPHLDYPQRQGRLSTLEGLIMNLSFNGLKQREIELEEGSARVSWYETQLLIGQPNGGSPKFQGVNPNII